MNLLDESSEIRATGFNDVVDKYYDLLQVGSVYVVSGASVKISNQKFTNLPNQYEITFEGNTVITLVLSHKGLTIA